MRQFFFLLIGVFFGIIMFKSEAASWFRIYEMFQFKSIHMYGIIGSALGFEVLITQGIKRFQIKSAFDESIVISDKTKSFYRYSIGGIIFGLGWGLSTHYYSFNLCHFRNLVLWHDNTQTSTLVTKTRILFKLF